MVYLYMQCYFVYSTSNYIYMCASGVVQLNILCSWSFLEYWQLPEKDI